MADTYTGVAASSFDQATYNLYCYYALRPELYYDPVATVKATAQAPGNGASVQFFIQSDLSAATTALSESTDVSAVAMSDNTVTLTPVEQGNAIITTAKLRGTTIIPFDPIVANVIGFNAGLSLDTLAQGILQAGTNVTYPASFGGFATSSARNTIQPSDLLTASAGRQAVAQLRRSFVQPINGYYMGFIHPDVSVDLRQSTGTAAWADPHAYSDPADIWNGEVGTFNGVRYIETPRSPLFADAGSSTTNTDVYGTLYIGQEALAKAHSNSDGNGPFPTIVDGPVTDKLRRFVPMGWYWFGVYGVFRQAALRRFETASSIGNNAAVGSN